MHPASWRQAGLIKSRGSAGIHPQDTGLRFVLPLVAVFAAGIDLAAAQVVPLPRPRPEAAPTSQVEEGPSACRVRLTGELALAPSVSNLDGAGECAVKDVVRLEAIMLRDGSRVTVRPPASGNAALRDGGGGRPLGAR
jgi:hypothetical protein